MYFRQRYENTIIPGVKLSGQPLVGLSTINVISMIDEYQQLIESQGFDFIYENKKSTIQPTVISAVDSDLTYKIIELKAEETAEKAFSYGHRSNLIGNLIDYYRSFLRH